MRRWLGILTPLTALTAIFALAIASPADAQVFKPKSKKAQAAEKKSVDQTKKQPRNAQTKKRVTKKKPKKAAAKRSDDFDLSEPETKSDKDYVKIWDDDAIE